MKEFCNSLDEKQLQSKVIVWREDEYISFLEAIILSEDHYIDQDDPESGCFPVSEFEWIEPDTKVKKVYDSGHPILHENF